MSYTLDGQGHLGWLPSGVLPAGDPYIIGGWRYANYSRLTSMSSLGALTSGTILLTAMWLPANGQPLTQLGFVTTATAASVPLHSWMVLCDADLYVIAASSDKATTAIPASTVQTYTISSTTPSYSGLYYVGIMVAATTVPTLAGFGSSGPAAQGQATGTTPILAGNSSTGQTTPPAVNTKLTAITSGANFPYILGA